MSSVPIDSTESFVSSMREQESTSACLCKKKPCSCGRMNGVNGHPLGFILPAVMTAHAAALSSPPDLACLLGLQALSQARFYNNNNNSINNNNNNNNSRNIDNNHNTNNCNSNLDPPKRVTTSPQVSSSNQTLGADRRRKKRGLVSRPSFSKSDKSSSTPDKYSEEKKHRCEYCGDCFGYKHVLQNHVRTHTGEKPFQCSEPECGKRFTRDHHLKTHMRLHTGEKPFKCDYCDKKFVQVANLRRHMRVHTGERPYQCDFGSCQAKFSDSNQLTAHRHTHEEPTTIVMTKDEVEEEVKPIPRSVFPYYQYNMSSHDIQEEPEDLSLKKSRLVS